MILVGYCFMQVFPGIDGCFLDFSIIMSGLYIYFVSKNRSFNLVAKQEWGFFW